MADRASTLAPCRPITGDELAQIYFSAKSVVIDAGYYGEVAWQASTTDITVDEKSFLNEAAWVILSAGMSERVVAQRFPLVRSCFAEFDSAKWIRHNAEACVDAALEVFNHPGKVEAIAASAEIVDSIGIGSIVESLELDGPTSLQAFPFIGPVTCWHLAKNLGAEVAKPDRHLVRLANELSVENVHVLCDMISDAVGEPTHVVDVVLWRACTLKASYRLTNVPAKYG